MPLPLKLLPKHTVALHPVGWRAVMRHTLTLTLTIWIAFSAFALPTTWVRAKAAEEAAANLRVATASCDSRALGYLVEARTPGEAAQKLKRYEDELMVERSGLMAADKQRTKR